MLIHQYAPRHSFRSGPMAPSIAAVDDASCQVLEGAYIGLRICPASGTVNTVANSAVDRLLLVLLLLLSLITSEVIASRPRRLGNLRGDRPSIGPPHRTTVLAACGAPLTSTGHHEATPGISAAPARVAFTRLRVFTVGARSEPHNNSTGEP
jgi:hypothetical protein